MKAADRPLTPLERIRGCLLAGACGDALGAPVEFLSLADIRGRWGAAGIRDFAPAYSRVGAITDDTQMTLFTLEGLIRARVRSEEKGVCSISQAVHHAYLRWLLTQGVEAGCEVDRDGWLFATEALHERRAPGNTCLGALAAATALGGVAENHSKGCGGVMRVAPVGLFASALGGIERAFCLGADVARLTHGHPSGYLAAGHPGGGGRRHHGRPAPQRSHRCCRCTARRAIRTRGGREGHRGRLHGGRLRCLD